MTIRLFLNYDGTKYNGWQIQNKNGEQNPSVKTIQGTLQSALRKLLLDDNIEVVGCSRTDAGVHAKEYVASFTVEKSIVPPERIAVAIGHLMPDDIIVYKSEVATDSFNARFSTISKTYRYYFYIGEFPDAMKLHHAMFVPAPSLNLVKMNEAATHICGTHDFDCFCADVANAKTTTRTIFNCGVFSLGDGLFYLEITGDGFLYNMVRIITGTLIYVGQGKIEPADIPSIIESKQRNKAGITAPPEGLHLWKVNFKDN